MKILVSSAVWGKAYCSIFIKYSLASLLSPGNIPRLSQGTSLTFHIVTTARDRRRLQRTSAIVALRRYCNVEWEVMEDFGIVKPPVGPGAQKYPFLSALQNLAITRALDHDVIVFNYADFIWADGSLSAAVEAMSEGDRHFDAVFGFCLPVDRDTALPDLDKYRQKGDAGIIELTPRDGARIAIERMHREAKIRFWDSEVFTSIPSYLMWPVDGQGVLIRAYHQTVLAMRIRRNDPQFCRGIVRGSLDEFFTTEFASHSSLVFATDSDRVLVFSLYHTPLNTRVTPEFTREMSLRIFLKKIVIPIQRRFAEHAICIKLHDGNATAWKQVADRSWNILRQAHEVAPFDPDLHYSYYKYQTKIPLMTRTNFMQQRLLLPLKKILLLIDIRQAIRPSFVVPPTLQKLFDVIENPSLLHRSSRIRRLINGKTFQLILRRLPQPTKDKASNEDDALFEAGDINAVESTFVARATARTVAPGISVERVVNGRLLAAGCAESMTTRNTDTTRLLAVLCITEELLRRAMKAAPFWAEPARALGRNLWFQGRFEEAIRMFASGEKLRDEMALMAEWPVDSCVFLPRDCTEVIDRMGHIDAFSKYKILTDDPRPYYLLAETQKIVNSAFLEYWKAYVTIVTDPDEIARLAPFERIYEVNWNRVMPQNGTMELKHRAMAAVHRAWHDAGRSPLIRLSQAHADALSQARIKWGMRADDQFVCLHVCSEGFNGTSRSPNTAVENYYPLIQALARMGLWVIYMGDSTMPSLGLSQCDTAGRAVDYARSPEKSVELDVALCAQCELFVSSNSGLHTVAHAFGRPVCEVDTIYHGFPRHPGDIFIPRHYFSHAKGRVLSLDEILGTDVVHYDHYSLFERAGISTVPNESDDIVETVREALAPSNYSVTDEALADKVCAVFDELNRRSNRGISGRLGRYFAAKYASLLLPIQTHSHDVAPSISQPLPSQTRASDVAPPAVTPDFGI